MTRLFRTTLLTVLALPHGCASMHGFLFGHGTEHRAEYEQLKATALAADTASKEAEALRELGCGSSCARMATYFRPHRSTT